MADSRVGKKQGLPGRERTAGAQGQGAPRTTCEAGMFKPADGRARANAARAPGRDAAPRSAGGEKGCACGGCADRAVAGQGVGGGAGQPVHDGGLGWA